MRMGKVQFRIWYAVDLDDPKQVNVATGFIVEDLYSAIKYNEIEAYFECIEDSSLTERDIHSAITDECEND